MRRQPIYFFATFLFAFAVTAAAQEYTSPHEVLQNEALRQDFTLQGEYLAKVGDGIGNSNMGLHLIADGGGKFRVVAYPGGLPGDGWKAGQPRLLGTAEVNGDEIAFNMTEGRGTNAGQNIVMPEKIEAKGKITVDPPQIDAEEAGGQVRMSAKIELPASGGMPTMVFEKQFRQSSTLGKEAPEGSFVIFDGTNLDKFEPFAKMNIVPIPQFGRPLKNMNTLWAEATALPFEKKPYKLHVEFMLSYMPQALGQQRSNSGVYLDERYECQILDSFGLEGKNNECGGFYQVAEPAVNMCFPPLTWQTYDFEFTPAKYAGDTKVANARVTVKHNGVLIHDNIEFQQETPGRKKEGAEPLGLYLQGHGNKVQFRNIWLQYQNEPVAQAKPVQVEVPEKPAKVETGVVVETSPQVKRGQPTSRPLFQRPLFQRLRTLR